MDQAPMGILIYSDRDGRFLPDFNPHQGFESPTEAIALIAKQPDRLAAMLAIVQANIEMGEFGFASEVVEEFQTIEPPQQIIDPKVLGPYLTSGKEGAAGGS